MKKNEEFENIKNRAEMPDITVQLLNIAGDVKQYF